MEKRGRECLMKRLTNYEKYKAQQKILPKPLEVNYENKDIDKILAWSQVSDFSLKDLGRGMLEHENFCLLESLFTAGDNNKETTISEKVQSCLIDRYLMTLSLKAISKVKNSHQNNNFCILMPPMSYTFPLLVAYHLILHHLGEGLNPTLGVRLAKDSGVLIVSDNVELLSRIWRTTISNNYLWKYIDTYTVSANKFKKFSFGSQRDDNKYTKDGTLPWICVYRAVRHALPEILEKRPEVIIIDLLPFRHRKRVGRLLEWAKQRTDHVIVIAPLYDNEVYSEIKKHIAHIIPIDRFTAQCLNRIFYFDTDLSPSGMLTASWSMISSLPYLHSGVRKANILRVNGIRNLDNKIIQLLGVLSHSYTKEKNQSLAFKRLTSVLFEIIGLPIPLGWYERLRANQGKYKLFDLIELCLKIPGETYEEQQINQTLLPAVISDVKDIYSILFNHQESSRGEAICSIVSQNINKRILIITSNQMAASEIKVWIRIKTGLSASDLANVQVVSQDQWAKEQLREIYVENEKMPELIVLTNPWKAKYLSSFYVLPETKLYMICLRHEEKIIKAQYLKTNKLNMNYVDDFIKSNLAILEVPTQKSDFEDGNDVHIYTEDFYVTPIKEFIPREEEKREYNINHLFDEEAFMSMFNLSQDNEETENDEVSINIKKIDSSFMNENEVIKCTRIKGAYKGKGYTKNFLINNESPLKILRPEQVEIVALRPIELQKGDCWIKLRKTERREVFETVLQLASNTMTMKWINLNVAEWKDMVKLLWTKFHSERSSKKLTYEKILRSVRENGGNVETIYTISNWVKGEVSSVKDERNVHAVALVLGEAQYLDRWKIIYNAMRQLWNIHIQLGRTLAKIINQYAGLSYSENALLPDWVDLGMEIRIPVEDLLNAIDVVEISNVEKDTDYITYEEITEIPLSDNNLKELQEKGWIKYGG